MEITKPIKRFFFDLDETLIHSFILTDEYLGVPCLPTGHFIETGQEYMVAMREGIQEMLKLARNKFGVENVFILTASVSDYSHKINKVCELGFPSTQIISRGDWQRIIPTAYGGHYIQPSPIAGPNNFLMDDLPFIYNKNKVDFLGIPQKNYLEVSGFYGVNWSGNNIVSKFKEFIMPI